jgi:antitoxin component YwqK of YwqJK toxin-antitoxin module
MKRLAALAVLALFLVGFITYTFAASQYQEPQKATDNIEGQQLKPKEIKMDRNHDGKVDHIEIYDAKGIISKIENDTKGDGKIDEWVYYENEIPVKAERDLTGSGKPNMTLFYDNKGHVIRSEADTKGDGKIDERVYYENDKPVKAEKDINGDGKADTWITY